MSTVSGVDVEGDPEKSLWKEHLFIIHDRMGACKEEDPPENAICVFLAPVEVEVRTQVYLTGGLVAMTNFATSITGLSPKVFQLGSEKIAVHCIGHYSLYLSGNESEPDDLLYAQLQTLFKAFCFYHGSIDAIFKSCGEERKRFSSTMTRIWSSLVSYFRPPRDAIHSGFRPIPSLGLPRHENRHYAMASQLLQKIQQKPGILGGCVLYRQRCMYTQLSPELTSYALALLQPTQSSSYTEEDNRRIQRRGLKIREMMLRGKNKLIRNREYRLRVYQNCFLGHEMVDLLIEKGEVRTRDAAKQLGRRLMQAGIIHHVMNEQDFRDEVRLYRFKVDEPETNEMKDYSQPKTPVNLRSASLHTQGSTGSDSRSDKGLDLGSQDGGDSSGYAVDLRPLVLAGHGRDARTTAALHGLSLPAGVHVLPVYLNEEQLDTLCDMASDLQDNNTELDSVIQENFKDREDARQAAEDGPAELYEELGLAKKFQEWLLEIGWDTNSEIEYQLKVSDRVLGELAAEYPTEDDDEVEEFKKALRSAKAKMTAKMKDRVENPKQKQLELYLQGLGSTVLVAMMTPDSTKNQEAVNQLAVDISIGLANLEQSLCAHTEMLGGLESQRTVESYNHIAFDNDTHAITGWCNTDRSMPEAKLLPDTEEDKAFVDAVSEMHSFFRDSSLPDVAEVMVRQNYRTAAYGKLAFGLESYIQLRQPGAVDGTMPRDESRPFDDDWADTPETVKQKLRNHHIFSL